MSRQRNPMGALAKMDLDEIARGLGIGISTVYKWRKGDTSPKAIQVYGICSLLRMRPTTFAPYTGHPITYKMPSTVLEAPPPEKIGEWVRERIDVCRRQSEGGWPTISYLTSKCEVDPRTVRKCIQSDEARWDHLLWFIKAGLQVLPWALLDVTQTVPIPQDGGSFSDYTEGFSEFGVGHPSSKTSGGAAKP